MDNSKKYASNHEQHFFTHQCPAKYRNATLSECHPRLLAAVNFGKQWVLKPTSLFLYGNRGTGKTYFSFALIREMLRKSPYNIWPRYFSSTDLDSRLLTALNDGREREEMDDRKREDLLFIDDIGRETKSERFRRQIFEIVNYRYSEELPTVFTSNYSLDDLEKSWDGAVTSRMQEWQSLHFKGSDMRINLP